VLKKEKGAAITFVGGGVKYILNLNLNTKTIFLPSHYHAHSVISKIAPLLSNGPTDKIG
jgi:hypothetical protein